MFFNDLEKNTEQKALQEHAELSSVSQSFQKGNKETRKANNQE